ncbi:hypothetical protein GGTG_13196 [Gaeumannomyces tritici R3-111a-1]|uniref:Zn(2)-C6 fungal-type domain-containing protein n=1 Tax=Gaeumannomyces tritici (strain R3-111a-1) TaxID=644352 RepID=J3PI68_GAET3|nr:hypothetical protein GGTG_13196 [Gaeumannomyces tritici R3-111a-1]EJT69580.1 hypothetical protein GGTG_13196 [Gaeumannomyces tritici R3-111a-1]
MSDGHSDDMPARKRIAVACGRCRKRKIRCSGDPGGGMPCTNCKSANAEACQFLRVSSQPTSLRHDGEPGAGSQHMDCGYNIEVSRASATRGSMPPLQVPYGAEMGPHGPMMPNFQPRASAGSSSGGYYGGGGSTARSTPVTSTSSAPAYNYAWGTAAQTGDYDDYYSREASIQQPYYPMETVMGYAPWSGTGPSRSRSGAVSGTGSMYVHTHYYHAHAAHHIPNPSQQAVMMNPAHHCTTQPRSSLSVQAPSPSCRAHSHYHHHYAVGSLDMHSHPDGLRAPVPLTTELLSSFAVVAALHLRAVAAMGDGLPAESSGGTIDGKERCVSVETEVSSRSPEPASSSLKASPSPSPEIKIKKEDCWEGDDSSSSSSSDFKPSATKKRKDSQVAADPQDEEQDRKSAKKAANHPSPVSFSESLRGASSGVDLVGGYEYSSSPHDSTSSASTSAYAGSSGNGSSSGTGRRSSTAATTSQPYIPLPTPPQHHAGTGGSHLSSYAYGSYGGASSSSPYHHAQPQHHATSTGAHGSSPYSSGGDHGHHAHAHAHAHHHHHHHSGASTPSGSGGHRASVGGRR